MGVTSLMPESQAGIVLPNNSASKHRTHPLPTFCLSDRGARPLKYRWLGHLKTGSARWLDVPLMTAAPDQTAADQLELKNRFWGR